MGAKSPYKAGDLVFAKVKGFPAWPARVQGKQPSGKFAIFFYGTYETASVKRNEIWPYNQENKAKFCQQNIVKRKGYSEGIEEIENTPELAPVFDDVLDVGPQGKVKTSPGTVKSSPGPVAPVVLKKPVKMLDGTPIKKVLDGTPNKSQPAGAQPSPRRGIKREPSTPDQGPEEKPPLKKAHTDSVDAPSDTASPSTMSRSGRVIRPKKFVDDCNSSMEQEETKVADKIIEEPRKVWVKLVATGDLVEINLDRDKPARWESNHQKLQWELATARNALKFKQQVEGGTLIPEEVRKKLAEKTTLGEEEQQVLKRAATLAKKKKKIQWLQTEQEMVDLDLGIKTSLNASNPQLTKCIQQLEALHKLDLKSLMLLKQPEVVMTIRRLRKYVGPLDQSGYSREEKSEIVKGVKQVKEKSGALLARLSQLFKDFDPSGSEAFADYFQAKADKFKERIKDWSEDKILCMTEEDENESPSES